MTYEKILLVIVALLTYGALSWMIRYLFSSLVKLGFFIATVRLRITEKKLQKRLEEIRIKTLLIQADTLLHEARMGITVEESFLIWEEILSNLENSFFLYELDREEIQNYHQAITDQLVILKEVVETPKEACFNIERLNLIHADLTTRLLRL